MCILNSGLHMPRAGKSTSEKEESFEAFEQIVVTSKQDEMYVLGGYMNGHIGATANVFQGTHGRNVFCTMNEEGEACQKPDSFGSDTVQHIRHHERRSQHEVMMCPCGNTHEIVPLTISTTQPLAPKKIDSRQKKSLSNY